MGIVIAAMLITFPLGGFANYHLALEKNYDSHKQTDPWAEFKPSFGKNDVVIQTPKDKECRQAGFSHWDGKYCAY
jgi:hypothetical protein